MRFSIFVVPTLMVMLFSFQAFACGEGDPDNKSSIRLSIAEGFCGEGKEQDGDGDGVVLNSAGFCGEGKDKDGDGDSVRLSGSCGGGKNEDGDDEDG